MLPLKRRDNRTRSSKPFHSDELSTDSTTAADIILPVITHTLHPGLQQAVTSARAPAPPHIMGKAHTDTDTRTHAPTHTYTHPHSPPP